MLLGTGLRRPALTLWDFMDGVAGLGFRKPRNKKHRAEKKNTFAQKRGKKEHFCSKKGKKRSNFCLQIKLAATAGSEVKNFTFFLLYVLSFKFSSFQSLYIFSHTKKNDLSSF